MTLNRFLYSKIGAFILILPFIKPASELTGSFDLLFDLLKVFAVITILIGYISIVGDTAKTITLLIIGMQFVFIISTIINQGDLKTVTVDAVSNIGICMYMDILCRKGIGLAARNFAFPCVIMAIIAVTTMFLYYPTGMYSVGDVSSVNFFWGFDNASAFRVLPSMFFACIYALERNKKHIYFWSFLFCVYCSVAFIYIRSLTAGALLMLVTLAFGFLALRKKGIDIINTRNMLLLAILISLFLLINKDNISILMDYGIKNDKYGSLLLRFSIWRRTLAEWRTSPIFGMGVEYPEITYNKILLDHPHNLFLDILYHGGIVAISGLVLYLAKMITNKQLYSKINTFTAVALFSIILLSQMDYYNAQYLFYPMLLLCFYISEKRKDAVNYTILQHNA